MLGRAIFERFDVKHRTASTGRFLHAWCAQQRFRHLLNRTSHILRLHAALAEGGPDVVLASAYMPGGTSEGVSWKRLLPSRLGNWLLRFAWPKRIYTSTCVVRGYRRAALERLAVRAADGEPRPGVEDRHVLENAAQERARLLLAAVLPRGLRENPRLPARLSRAEFLEAGLHAGRPDL
jgi:hypothetical protein